MRITAVACFVLLLELFCASSFAQPLSVGAPVLEDTWRRLQISGKRDINVSFTVRPVYPGNVMQDSGYTQEDSLFESRAGKDVSFARDKGTVRLLPITIKQQYNAHHPYGWNDGTMIPSAGYQSLVSFGFYSRVGPLSVQVRPEVVYAQNKSFATFSSSRSDSIWNAYYYVQNRIDNPEKYGTGRYAKMLPGQSSVRLNVRKLSLGVSTENLWWGPGIRNALIMSNNAPGFEHITFNTTSPVSSRIGTFEWQVIAGNLKSSDILPADTSQTFNGRKLYAPKPGSDRYLNGMILTWQPKWTTGLHLGFTRVFYQYKYNLEESLNGYLPVLGALFKDKVKDENLYGRDQLISAFFRLVMPESNAEVYGEYGRNDHAADLRDFLLEPEHARAYIIGLRKLFPSGKQNEVELFTEFTHLQNPETRNVRALEGWYTHYQVRHGYTHLGQVIGAGIGPGGSSQIIGLNCIKAEKQWGAALERVVRNNDLFYQAIGLKSDRLAHWVDVSANFNAAWQQRRFIYSADLALIYSMNYQWQQKNNIMNLHAQLSASYLF